MDPFQDRLTDEIVAFGNDSECYEIAAHGDDLAGIAVQEVVRALQQLPELAAAKGMDFGRGYALAIKDVTALLTGESPRG